MATATDLLDLSLTRSFAPWWHKLSKDGHGIRVVVEDPNRPEGSGITLTRILSPAEIHAAFDAIAETHLCCGDEMRREGYGYGCAQDEDLILQKATFGEIIYG